jgi:hypothetical protein
MLPEALRTVLSGCLGRGISVGGAGIGFHPEESTSRDPLIYSSMGNWTVAKEQFVTPPTTFRYDRPVKIIQKDEGDFRAPPGPPEGNSFRTAPSASEADDESILSDALAGHPMLSSRALTDSRKIMPDPLSTFEELLAEQRRPIKSPDPDESRPFCPTFHPMKWVSAADLD